MRNSMSTGCGTADFYLASNSTVLNRQLNFGVWASMTRNFYHAMNATHKAMIDYTNRAAMNASKHVQTIRRLRAKLLTKKGMGGLR